VSGLDARDARVRDARSAEIPLREPELASTSRDPLSGVCVSLHASVVAVAVVVPIGIGRVTGFVIVSVAMS
jgi:hypothetical protein